MTDLPERNDAAEQLRAIVERIERLNDEIADLNAEKALIRAEAKADGFDVPTITAIIKRRKLEPSAVLEADLLLDTYEQALGCGAAATGVLSAQRGADGVFEVRMVAGPQPEAGEKLTKASKARRDAAALAELARMARETGQ